MPSASGAETATDQVPPDRVADNVSTTDAPCFTRTDTVAESPAAEPAVPEIVGDALFDVDPSAGDVITTVGATVATVNVFAVDVDELPDESDCDAITVYVPSASVVADTVQVPPDRVADND